MLMNSRSKWEVWIGLVQNIIDSVLNKQDKAAAFANGPTFQTLVAKLDKIDELLVKLTEM